MSSTVIDPVSKEILPFLAGQNFGEGIVPRYIPHWLKVAVNTPGNKKPLAGDAEKFKYRRLM